jgi:hypothetical protein
MHFSFCDFHAAILLGAGFTMNSASAKNPEKG